MLNTILIDVGPLIALFDKSDKYHQKTKTFLAKNKFGFVSTIAVLTEVMYMLDFSHNAQIDFLEWVKNNCVILYSINNEDIPRIIYLTNKYSDLPMDFADASLVIAAEKTGIKIIISIDNDFYVYRLLVKEKIKNVFDGRF